MLWLLLAVLWFVAAVGRPKFSIRFGAADAAVLLLVVWHTIAAVWAVRNGSPRPAINMLWEWLGMAAGFFLARQLLTTPRELRAAVAVMVALAVGIAGYGVYQWRWEIPQTQAMYKADPEAALRKAGLMYAAGSPERTLYDDRVRTAAPMATFALSNSLAAFLSPWLVILAAIAGSHWAGRENRRRLWGILPCCVLIAACLLLTRGRGGCIAALLGLGTLLLLAPILRRRLNWKLPAAAAAVLLAAVLAAVAIVWQLDPGAFSRADNVARISLSICPIERSNDCRSSVARVRAGQLPGGVYPVQVAGGQRGDRRSAQLPARSLGHRRHTGRHRPAGRARLLRLRGVES